MMHDRRQPIAIGHLSYSGDLKIYKVYPIILYTILGVDLISFKNYMGTPMEIYEVLLRYRLRLQPPPKRERKRARACLSTWCISSVFDLYEWHVTIYFMPTIRMKSSTSRVFLAIYLKKTAYAIDIQARKKKSLSIMKYMR